MFIMTKKHSDKEKKELTMNIASYTVKAVNMLIIMKQVQMEKIPLQKNNGMNLFLQCHGANMFTLQTFSIKLLIDCDSPSFHASPDYNGSFIM